MTFLKLQTGEQKSATIKSVAHREKDGQWGMQYFYDFIIDGQDFTLSVSPKSGVVQDMQTFKDGDNVVIKKVSIGQGRSTYHVFPPNDIAVQPQNANLKTGAQAYGDYVKTGSYEGGVKIGEGLPQVSRTDKSIALQSARRDAVMFLQNDPGAGPERVMEFAETFYKWHMDTLNQQ